MVRLERPLDEIRPRLERAFGARLKGIVLYGSRARGDHRPDSDLDLLVLLTGPVLLTPDLDTAIEALYPLQLELDYPIHAMPHDEAAYRARDCRLYENAAREGIPL